MARSLLQQKIPSVAPAQRRGIPSTLRDNRPQAHQLKQMQALMQDGVAQRVEEEEPDKAAAAPAQLAGKGEDEEEPPAGPVQAKSADTGSTAPAAVKSSTSGLPGQLKAGIESLSGMSMDHVKVNYNSDKPAQLNAHAYAQGSDIHVAPGQEQHLPHEAWHVVQQAQGRVQPTMQMKAGVPVNDNPGLESEADVMGQRALAAGATQLASRTDTPRAASHRPTAVAQRRTLAEAVSLDKLGLGPTGHTFPVLDGVPHAGAELYSDAATPLADNRTDAMAQIATRAAKIGKDVKSEASAVVPHDKAPFDRRYANNPGAYFYAQERLGDEKYEAIDPFTHGSYCQIKDGSYLVLMYQHTYGFDGYITGVEDGTAEKEGVYKREIAASMKHGKNRADTESDVEYSNQHAQTGGKNLNELANEGQGHQNFDAVTKLAGEGARFQWVRNHIGTISDSTEFTAPATDSIPALSITFAKLWVSWKDWFAGEYDIPDKKIIEVLRAKWQTSDGRKRIRTG